MKKSNLTSLALTFFFVCCGTIYVLAAWSPGGFIAQNTVLAGSDAAGNAAPSGRALVNNDLPVVSATKGGTGVANAGTFTFSGSGALATGGFTLTVPATGSAALLGTANVFTAANIFQSASLTLKDAAGTGAGVLKLQDTSGGQFISLLTASNEAADRTLTIPLLGGNDTLPTLGLAQTWTATNTMRAVLPSTTLTYESGTQSALWASTYTGGFVSNVVSKTTTYTATTQDFTILCSTSGGAWSLSLPAAASNNGRIYVIKKTTSDTNALTIDPNGAETIEGAATTTLSKQDAVMVIQSDNVNWRVIGGGGDYLDARITGDTNTAATTVWKDVTSVSPGPGEWDISGTLYIALNGATCTQFIGAVSQYSATTTTDHVIGDNVLYSLPPTSTANGNIAIPSFRVVVTAALPTVYLKVNATFSAGTPQYRGRVSARRIR